MTTYEKFTSNQNKGLVWKLLCDDGIFATIPETKAGAVKEDFDRKIETIARQITATDTIVNLDKRVISEMIDKYKKKEPPQPQYNAAEISETRQKVFQAELKTKQTEFNTFNAVRVPDKIDFSDNLDSPMGSEMDKILAQQIALREKQLNMVLKTQDKEAATKWIQNPGEGNKTEEPVKLKIGENISMTLKEPPTKVKKVNFSETTEDDTFMALLKRKDIDVPTSFVPTANVPTSFVPTSANESSTITLLREILNKQNQILEILNSKN
jgi:hypothetical protein